jgi:arylsulfatase A-like enzyme
MKKQNVIIVFGDQWRKQATGYSGNNVVKTPNIDKLAKQSVNFDNAVAGCPVCSPYRASLLTGQYPQTHGVFVNDVCLSNKATSIADAFKNAGYDTAYVGKWHVDGHGRSNYIPPKRRQGFEYWKVLECTHQYNNSFYYANDSDEKKTWKGYDAIAQTKDMCEYIRNHAGNDKPFFSVLSWGPPHAPLHSAPEEFKKLYTPDMIELRPNVPEKEHDAVREELAGYYAHCTTLDFCMGELLKTIKDAGIEKETIVLFTSDHGDMLRSQGHIKKQRPWDESMRVPFLVYTPMADAKKVPALIDAPDIMPTLLGLAGVPVPESVQGFDYSEYILHGDNSNIPDSALLMCMHPFSQYSRDKGGKEYRGIRTERYTYVRDLENPWLLYDNQTDPYQMNNLVGNPETSDIEKSLDEKLMQKLASINDEFLPGEHYIEKWGYVTDETGTVPYKK